MVFFSILRFSIGSTGWGMCLPMSPATATMETASMRAAHEARPPARGKAPDIATVIKPTERPRARSRLKVRCRRPVEPLTCAARPTSVERVAVVEVVTINDRPAVGDVGVVIVNHPMAMPVASPVMPAPTISSEETDAEPNSKSNPPSGKEDSRHGVPARIRQDRLAIHEPGIICGYIDDLRIGRFDDDCVPLSRYLLLFVAIEVAGLVSLLTHCLDGIRHILLLVGVCVAKR